MTRNPYIEKFYKVKDVMNGVEELDPNNWSTNWKPLSDWLTDSSNHQYFFYLKIWIGPPGEIEIYDKPAGAVDFGSRNLVCRVRLTEERMEGSVEELFLNLQNEIDWALLTT